MNLWWLMWAGWSLAAEPALSSTTLSFPDAEGPPTTSCAHDLAAAPASVQWPKRAARKATASSGKVPAVKRLRLGDVVTPVSEHPAMTPDSLPPIPLEGSDAVRARLAAVWERAAAGEPVRLSVFGASHTGGDWWTGHLRRLLQDRWGDRGHGFVLPAPLYRGYRGHDVNLCATAGWTADWAGRTGGLEARLLGFMGASVRASDPGAFGWIQTTRENPHGRKVSRFDLYVLEGPDAGALSITVDDLPAKTVPLTASAPGLRRIRVSVPDGAHRLRVGPAGTGEVRLFGASLERDTPGVLVDAMGIRGRTARTWLSWSEPMWKAGITALSPDVVVLAYGTNEAADTDYDMETYTRDLHAVLRRLRSAVGEEVPCVLVGPSDRVTRGPDDVYVPWPRTDEVAQVQREVAPQHGCLFWDWQAATGGPGSMLAFYEQQPKMGAGDLIHFRAAGYTWSAERFLRALDEAVDEAVDPRRDGDAP